MKTRQRGNALVETALILPVLIGSALVIGDLYNINQARANMELSAHSIASVLSMQNRLDSDSLQALVDQAAAPDVLGDYELVINRVQLDRSMPWKPLYRGNAEGICEEMVRGGVYAGELPEAKPSEDEDEGTSSTSILAVQLCRDSDSLLLNSGLLPTKQIQTLAFARLSYNDIQLDAPLRLEVGLGEED